ncbi:LacI family DNA-binding transcriptional regulator [Geminisphaera colitermitum]|uniref:LacI family DNA-binding transcriptional regulator n=1 Tax=Geminisphaera colitermitum TaxID=1148786 RepID=UPI000158C5C3|nr:LacI family DNA-binding transcriptional regulator [Geminisphaera colitermitum]
MPRKPKRTTVYSLGNELDVSVATISKALRGSPEISVELRKKVRDLAAKRNFKPRVVSRKVPNICVLIQQYPGHTLDFGLFLSTVMEGVAQYVQEEGLEMSIFADTIDKLNACDIVRELRRRSIDGAVILRSNDESTYFAQLDAEGFPHCALLSTTPAHRDNVITVNNDEVGYRATRHLIDKGHREIGVLVSPPAGVSGQARLSGYRRALAEAGIAFNEQLVAHEVPDKTGLQFGSDAVQTLTRANPRMTALFVMDHAVVVGLLHGASRIGLSIPRDLSVISCDDYPETAFLQPPVTVIDIPNRALGYEAARQVYRLIRGLAPLPIDTHIDLNGRLIERESTRTI